MTVLSADLRKSTFLMKEARAESEYITIMNTFFDLVEKGVRSLDGWYDKFLGDGFLAYWLPEEEGKGPNVAQALKVAKSVHGVWNAIEGNLPGFTHNWPAGAGLGVGIDVGPGRLAFIGGDLTIVGPPVIGASRMCSAATAGETIMNSHAGYDLHQQQADLQHLVQFEVDQTIRSTKEYAEQEVYSIRFPEEPDGA